MQPDAYKKYLLVILLIIYAFNFVDRMALGIVLQDIKAEFVLSDTELGLLTGAAPAIFFALMGLPIARWADQGNRVLIIAIMTLLQAGMISLFGLAATFFQLLAVRVAISVGEAGCVPPAHSLIADHFSRSERPRAVAIYKLGSPLVLGLGYFLAGWLNELHGWRTTFVVLGVPGVILSAIAWFTLYEPRSLGSAIRSKSLESAQTTEGAPSFGSVCTVLWSNPPFRHLLHAFSVWYFFGYGLVQWQPTFFIRSHGLSGGELGTWFAAIFGLGGGLGTYLGGVMAARFAAEDEARQIRACATAFAFFPIVNAYAYLSDNQFLALSALALATFGIAMTLGPIFAAIQTIVPPHMRAMAIALVFLFSSLIGMGLGPLAAGALSDLLEPWFGSDSLRYALVILSPGYFWAAWHLKRASQTVGLSARDAHLQECQASAPVGAK